MTAVSTGGGSPALAGWLRDQIAADVLTDRAVAAVEQLASERAAVKATGGSTENIDWRPRIRDLMNCDNDGDIGDGGGRSSDSGGRSGNPDGGGDGTALP
jgi:hypothetical protein